MSFLTEEERREFDTEKRRFSRILHRSSKESLNEQVSIIPMTEHLVSTVRKLIAGPNAKFRCEIITVEDGDGMTWSAEMTQDALHKAFPTFEIREVDCDPSVGGMHKIAKLLSPLRVGWWAWWYGLGSPLLWLDWKFVFCPLGLILALGPTLQAWVKAQYSISPLDPFTLMGDPLFIFVFIIMGMCLLVSTGVSALFLTPGRKESETQRFRDTLNAQDGTRRYWNFVRRLATCLRSRGLYPRVVIIDNFHLQDKLTQDAIVAYIEYEASTITGKDFWVVFEPSCPSQLSALVLSKRTVPGATMYYGCNTSKQTVLSEAQRTELAQLLGKPERARFETVKEICGTGGLDVESASGGVLGQCGIPFDSPYGQNALEMLYLLSFLATPGDLYLNAETIMRWLHRVLATGQEETGPLRVQVLRYILSAKHLTRQELSTNLRDALRQFSPAFRFRARNDEFKVRTNVADLLCRQYEELQLCKPGICHVFWCLFIYDQFQNRQREAFWMRKLSHHLRSCDPSTICEETPYRRVVQQLYECSLFTARSCLETCLYGELYPILDRSLEFLESISEESNFSRRVLRYVHTCLEVFLVVGDQRLLELAASAVVLGKHRLPPSSNNATPLMMIFLDSTRLPETARQALVLSPYFARGQTSQEFPPIRLCMELQAEWLRLSLLGIASMDDLGLQEEWTNVGSGLEHILLDSLTTLDTTISELAELRIGRESLEIIVSNLSLALWCYALYRARLYAQYSPLCQLQNLSGEAEFAAKEVRDILEKAHKNSLFFAQETLDCAERLSKLMVSGVSSFGIHSLLLSALTQELAIIAAASIHIMGGMEGPTRNLNDSNDKKREQAEEMKLLLTSVQRVLRFRVARSTDSDRLSIQFLTEQMDDLFCLVELSFARMGLEHFAQRIALIRFQFLMSQVPDNWRSLWQVRPLVEGLVPTLSDGESLIGVTAHMSCAAALRWSNELSGHYFVQGARIAIERDYNTSLGGLLSFLAVLLYETVTLPADTVLRQLVGRGKESELLAWVNLEKLRDGRAAHFLVALANTAMNANDKNLRTRTLDALRTFAAEIGDIEARDAVLAHLEYVTLAMQAKEGDTPLLQEILNAAERWRSSPVTAALMVLALEHHQCTSELVDLALKTFEQHRDTYAASHVLSLAVNLIDHLSPDSDSAEAESIKNYLKEALPRWESHLSAEYVRGVCLWLSQMDRDRIAYWEEQVNYWGYIAIERNHLQMYPQWGKERRFALIFRTYALDLLPWGLQIKPSVLEVQNSLRQPNRTKQQVIMDWKERAGESVPPPVVGTGPEFVVSGEFIVLTDYLYCSSVASDLTFEDDRQRFDDAAVWALRRLLEEMLLLRDLPEGVRSLLERYASRLLAYTIVPGDE